MLSVCAITPKMLGGGSLCMFPCGHGITEAWCFKLQASIAEKCDICYDDMLYLIVYKGSLVFKNM